MMRGDSLVGATALRVGELQRTGEGRGLGNPMEDMPCCQEYEPLRHSHLTGYHRAPKLALTRLMPPPVTLRVELPRSRGDELNPETGQ